MWLFTEHIHVLTTMKTTMKTPQFSADILCIWTINLKLYLQYILYQSDVNGLYTYYTLNILEFLKPCQIFVSCIGVFMILTSVDMAEKADPFVILNHNVWGNSSNHPGSEQDCHHHVNLDNQTVADESDR